MVVVFVLVRVVPGDPIAMMIAPGASEADIAALRAVYGLDLSIWQQFKIWFLQVLQGNLGTSISMKQNVLTIIADRLPATLELAMLALLIAVLLGGSIALLSTAWRGTWAESLIDNVNGIMLAVPDFIWALTFVLVLGVWCRCCRSRAAATRRWIPASPPSSSSSRACCAGNSPSSGTCCGT
jgi:ABC-type dipeptide/oligopeptide/nickel transport system permease component